MRLLNLVDRYRDKPLACFGPYADWWTSGNQREQRNAAALCVSSNCPAMEDCKAWAEESREPSGVWGGLTPQDRGWDGVTFKGKRESSGVTV